MKKLLKVLLAFAAVALILWIGLQIAPRTEKRGATGSAAHVTLAQRALLPELSKYLDNQSPDARSAVVWGHGRMKWGFLTVPFRLTAYYVPGSKAMHKYEFTLFGFPIRAAYETWENERGTYRTSGPFSKDESGPLVSQAATMSAWAEAVFTPGMFLSDPLAQWTRSAPQVLHLSYPESGPRDSLTFIFDIPSGKPLEASGLRYGHFREERAPWKVEYSDWKNLHGYELPTRLVFTWGSETKSAMEWTVEDVQYNVNVEEKWAP